LLKQSKVDFNRRGSFVPCQLVALRAFVKPTSRLSHLEMRKKFFGYIELISSTGKRDTDELR
jgi:hypothetical protein